MREIVRVNLRRQMDDSYPIVIGPALFPQIGADLAKSPLGRAAAVISDSNVAPRYGQRLLFDLEKAGVLAHLLSFPSGEKSKSRKIKEEIEDQMFQLGLGRDTVILALGGGVVGDLAGFIAATYHRGIPYIQIPTTLLSQVDSSIGGKTAIDVPYGKNLLGAFHQPKRVYIDPETLETLPRRELRAGMAEVIKYAVILDPDLFGFLEANVKALLELEEAPLTHLLTRCCQLKANVVEADEREENLRKILNFGHTIGHALERWGGYGRLHGEAVAVGMVVEGWIACRVGCLDQDALGRIQGLLERFDLPSCLPAGVEVEEVVQATYWDKKARQGRPQYVIPHRIGEMEARDGLYGIPVEEEVVRWALRKTSGNQQAR